MYKYILLMLINLHCLKAQEFKSIECTYKINVVDLTPEKLNAISNVNVKNRMIFNQNEDSKKDFILKGNLQNAVFYEVQKLKSDILKNRNDIESEKYYYDLNEQIVYNWTNLGGQQLLVSYDFSIYNWNITKESKIIEGYNCYKANGIYKVDDDIRGKKNIDIVAWFCPELPFKYGPLHYFGLPGLIFEAYPVTGTRSYILKSIKFYKEVLKIDKPVGLVKTAEEYKVLFNKSFQN